MLTIGSPAIPEYSYSGVFIDRQYLKKGFKLTLPFSTIETFDQFKLYTINCLNDPSITYTIKDYFSPLTPGGTKVGWFIDIKANENIAYHSVQDTYYLPRGFTVTFIENQSSLI